MSTRADAIRATFDRWARKYDRSRRMLVPCFDRLYGAALDLIPYPKEHAFSVLDLGAGTGLLSAFIAAEFPRASITLADIAPEMLAQARERLRPFGARVNFVEMDYAAGALGGPYGAIVSALSIHHLEHPEKRALFGRIYSALEPGGIFINADVVAEDSTEAEIRTQEAWLKSARAMGASEADIEGAIERQKHDRCAAVGEQLRWLGEAGFSDVELVFRDLIFAVYGGRRRGGTR